MNTQLIRSVLTSEAAVCWWLQVENKFLDGDKETLAQRLLQYYELPKKIVSLFQLARQHLSPWPAVKGELESNIEDELGARTAGVAHVVILTRQLERELGVSFTDRQVEPATASCIQALRAIISSSGEAACGAAYALEATAIAELKLVAKLINKVAVLGGLKAPIDPNQAPQVLDDAEKINLSLFFALHTGLIEQDHEQHLADAILSDAKTNEQCEAIATGFRDTLRVLDAWFTSMCR